MWPIAYKSPRSICYYNKMEIQAVKPTMGTMSQRFDWVVTGQHQTLCRKVWGAGHRMVLEWAKEREGWDRIPRIVPQP